MSHDKVELRVVNGSLSPYDIKKRKLKPTPTSKGKPNVELDFDDEIAF